MKIFISADLEGCAGVTTWDETDPKHKEYDKAALEMTEEVIALCEGLLENGVDEIVVKDAHDTGKNIIYNMLPSDVKIFRGWSGGPYSMVDGLDNSFDGAIFLGYHSAESQSGNPLSHTMTRKINKITINERLCSEYLLHTYAAASFGVPVIMITGDKMICEDAKDFNSCITTVEVKKGIGSGVLSLNSKDTQKLIKGKVKEALNKVEKCNIEIPNEFTMRIGYKNHDNAYKAAFYPGVKKIDDCIIEYKSRNIKDMLVARMFIA
ncbi:MAG: M55 family metallopeptidase [Bacillota bacterium]|nr:M55 family metallopeptidase [Bacillota bacterium]